MGDNNENKQWHFGRIHDIISKSSTIDVLFIPIDLVQYVWHK